METTKKNVLQDDLDLKLKEYLIAKQFYEIGLYRLDTVNKLLFFNDEKVKLTRKDTYLIVFFAANLNQVVLRADLLQSIWIDNTHENGRSFDVYMCKMRKLLSKDPAIYIVNVHGKGYRMVVR
jgi:DNA-binding response OmpR family regulator